MNPQEADLKRIEEKVTQLYDTAKGQIDALVVTLAQVTGLRGDSLPEKRARSLKRQIVDHEQNYYEGHGLLVLRRPD